MSDQQWNNVGRSPNFRTVFPIVWQQGGRYGDTRSLPAGAFVRPVQPQYVPKHVLEDPRWKEFRSEVHVFVYCHYGFIMTEKSNVEEA